MREKQALELTTEAFQTAALIANLLSVYVDWSAMDPADKAVLEIHKQRLDRIREQVREQVDAI